MLLPAYQSRYLGKAQSAQAVCTQLITWCTLSSPFGFELGAQPQRRPQVQASLQQAWMYSRYTGLVWRSPDQAWQQRSRVWADVCWLLQPDAAHPGPDLT